MRQLTLALYAEGSTDGDFLPLLIERTTQDILSQYDSQPTQVNIAYQKCNKPENIVKRDQCILCVAQETERTKTQKDISSYNTGYLPSAIQRLETFEGEIA